MLVAPEDLSTEEVLRVVQEHWDPKVRSGALFPQGSGAPHWVCGGARHPRWFVTADDVTAPGRLAEHEAAYAAARRLAHKGLHFVVPTVAPVGGGIGVRHGRHLVTVTAYHEGESRPGPYADDNQRALVAHEIGLLHATRPPRRAPVWKPGLASRSELVQLLETVDDTQWDTGPFGESVRTALRDNRPRLLRLFARFDVLAAQALASRKTWVVTHGEPHTANVLWRLGGPVLLDWESLRLAPRERDLRVVLRDAESAEPLSAYVASGGPSTSMPTWSSSSTSSWGSPGPPAPPCGSPARTSATRTRRVSTRPSSTRSFRPWPTASTARLTSPDVRGPTVTEQTRGRCDDPPSPSLSFWGG